MNLSRLCRAVLAAVAPLLLFTGVAAAHAERSSETPREGARLGAPPNELTIDFTEPPTSEFVLVVLDGCRREVVRRADVQDRTITAALDEGRPGRWQVSSSVISGIDGHRTDDSFSFAVRGEADCAAALPESGDAGESDDVNPTPFFIGGAVLLLVVAAAFAVRLRG